MKWKVPQVELNVSPLLARSVISKDESNPAFAPFCAGVAPALLSAKRKAPD
jgi:hypothetical protein